MLRRTLLLGLFAIILFLVMVDVQAQTVFVQTTDGAQLELEQGRLIVKEDELGKKALYELFSIGSDSLLLRQKNAYYSHPYSVPADFSIGKKSYTSVRARRVVGWTLVAAGTSIMGLCTGVILTDRSPNYNVGQYAYIYSLVFLPVGAGLNVMSIIPFTRANATVRNAKPVHGSQFYIY